MCQIVRKSIVVLTLAVTALSLFGCGRSDDGLETVDDTPATLDFVSSNWIGTYWQNAEESVTELYQEKHPNVTFEHRYSGPGGGVDLSDSDPPDIVGDYLGVGLFQEVEEGNVIDLSILWEELELSQVYPEATQQIATVNGRHYALPVAAYWAGIYYNTAIFESYGLEPPQTWDQFLDICDTLLLYGETPISIAGDSPWVAMLWFDYLNMRLNGPEYHQSLILGNERYDDVRVYQVLELWRNLFDRGCFIERPEIVDDLVSLTALVRGDNGQLSGPDAVMALVDTSTLNDLPAKFQAELGFFPFPVIDPAIPVGEVMLPIGYVVPSGADEISASIRFLEFMSTAEAQNALLQRSLQGTAAFVPMHTGVDSALLTPKIQQARTMLNDADMVTLSYMQASPRTMWMPMWRLTRELLQQGKDVGTILAEWEEARLEATRTGDLPIATP